MEKRKGFIKRPIIYGLTFSVGSYLFLSLVALYLGFDQFFKDLSLALGCAFLGFAVSGSIAFRNRFSRVAEDITDIVIDKDNLSKWQKSLMQNLYSKRQYVLGIVLVIILLPPSYLLGGPTIITKYNLYFYILILLLLFVPIVIGLMSTLWIMLTEMFWVFTYRIEKNKGDEFKIGLGNIPSKLRDFPLLPTKNYLPLFIDMRPLHPDGHGGLKQLGGLAISGTILLAIGSSLAIPMIMLLEIPKAVSLLIAIAISLIVVLSFFFTTYNIQKIVELEKTEKMKKISGTIEEKYENLLSGKVKDFSNFVDAIEAYERAYEKFKKTREWPIDITTIVELVGSCILPLAAYFVFGASM